MSSMGVVQKIVVLFFFHGVHGLQLELAQTSYSNHLGEFAPLNNKGFEQVSASGNKAAMRQYIMRLLDASNLEIKELNFRKLDEFAERAAHTAEFDTLPDLKAALVAKEWVVKKIQMVAAKAMESLHGVVEKVSKLVGGHRSGDAASVARSEAGTTQHGEAASVARSEAGTTRHGEAARVHGKTAEVHSKAAKAAKAAHAAHAAKASNVAHAAHAAKASTATKVAHATHAATTKKSASATHAAKASNVAQATKVAHAARAAKASTATKVAHATHAAKTKKSAYATRAAKASIVAQATKVAHAAHAAHAAEASNVHGKAQKLPIAKVVKEAVSPLAAKSKDQAMTKKKASADANVTRDQEVNVPEAAESAAEADVQKPPVSQVAENAKPELDHSAAEADKEEEKEADSAAQVATPTVEKQSAEKNDAYDHDEEITMKHDSADVDSDNTTPSVGSSKSAAGGGRANSTPTTQDGREADEVEDETDVVRKRAAPAKKEHLVDEEDKEEGEQTEDIPSKHGSTGASSDNTTASVGSASSADSDGSNDSRAVACKDKPWRDDMSNDCSSEVLNQEWCEKYGAKLFEQHDGPARSGKDSCCKCGGGLNKEVARDHMSEEPAVGEVAFRSGVGRPGKCLQYVAQAVALVTALAFAH